MDSYRDEGDGGDKSRRWVGFYVKRFDVNPSPLRGEVRWGRVAVTWNMEPGTWNSDRRSAGERLGEGEIT